jgi:hypothetical protein
MDRILVRLLITFGLLGAGLFIWVWLATRDEDDKGELWKELGKASLQLMVVTAGGSVIAYVTKLAEERRKDARDDEERAQRKRDDAERDARAAAEKDLDRIRAVRQQRYARLQDWWNRYYTAYTNAKDIRWMLDTMLQRDRLVSSDAYEAAMRQLREPQRSLERLRYEVEARTSEYSGLELVARALRGLEKNLSDVCNEKRCASSGVVDLENQTFLADFIANKRPAILVPSAVAGEPDKQRSVSYVIRDGLLGAVPLDDAPADR